MRHLCQHDGAVVTEHVTKGTVAAAHTLPQATLQHTVVKFCAMWFESIPDSAYEAESFCNQMAGLPLPGTSTVLLAVPQNSAVKFIVLLALWSAEA